MKYVFFHHLKRSLSTAEEWNRKKDLVLFILAQPHFGTVLDFTAPLTVSAPQTHRHTHPRTTALADVPWDIQVNQRPIITIILPGNSGSRMPSAAPQRLLSLPQRHDPVSAAHTHHYKAAKLTEYKGEFARDEKFQLSLSDFWFFPLVSELILSRLPERRLSSQQTVWLQLTCDISEQLPFILMLAEHRRRPSHCSW